MVQEASRTDFGDMLFEAKAAYMWAHRPPTLWPRTKNHYQKRL